MKINFKFKRAHVYHPSPDSRKSEPGRMRAAPPPSSSPNDADHRLARAHRGPPIGAGITMIRCGPRGLGGRRREGGGGEGARGAAVDAARARGREGARGPSVDAARARGRQGAVGRRREGARAPGGRRSTPRGREGTRGPSVDAARARGHQGAVGQRRESARGLAVDVARARVRECARGPGGRGRECARGPAVDVARGEGREGRPAVDVARVRGGEGARGGRGPVVDDRARVRGCEARGPGGRRREGARGQRAVRRRHSDRPSTSRGRPMALVDGGFAWRGLGRRDIVF